MDYEPLLRIVEHARRRLVTRRAWWWGGRVGAVLAAVALALVGARTILPVDLPHGILAAGAIALGALVAIVVRLFARITPLFAAQVLDHRFGLADRLATAVELVTGRHRATALTDVVIQDAVHHAAGLDQKRALPTRPDRMVGVALILAVLALIGGVGLIGISVPGTPAREVARTIQREGRRLQRTGETLEERARTERARITRRVAPSLQRLGESLQRERIARGEALARLGQLSRQLEAERRQVTTRREQISGAPAQQPRPTLPNDLFQQRAAADRAVRQIREIADRLAQARTPQEREAILRQLAALAGGGDEGDVPARTRQQAAQAREQLGAGDTAGARRTLQQGAQDLDDLHAMLADEEGLQQAQRDVQQSAENIQRGRAVPGPEAEDTQRASAQPGAPAPGNRPPSESRGPDSVEPQAGPNQGSTPGQGTISEKLGAPTSRIEANREQSRVQGLQGEGRMITSEMLGPGRRGRVTANASQAVAMARTDADRYMARMRIPPEYRDIVRRYFEALAQNR
jgi:hypothetical protein